MSSVLHLSPGNLRRELPLQPHRVERDAENPKFKITNQYLNSNNENPKRVLNFRN